MKTLTDFGTFIAIAVAVTLGVAAILFALWGPDGLLPGG